MKKIKFISLIMAFAMIITLFAGCATVPKVVATVNGVEISDQEFTETLNGLLSSYGITEETMGTMMDSQQIVDFKNNVIDDLVLQELMVQYANENGLAEFTEEEKLELQESATYYLESLKDSFTAEVESGIAAGEQYDRETEAQKRYDEYIEQYDYTVESLTEQYEKQSILDKVYTSIIGEAVLTDEDIEQYYNSLLAEQQALDQTDSATALSNYVNYANEVTVYIPVEAQNQVKNVKHILFQLPEDVQAEIQTLELEGDTEGAEAIKQEALAEILPEAQEVLERAQSGEDFDTLIEQYNDDPGMASMPEGYMAYEGAPFVTEFLEASLAIENVGDIYPELVESDFGYHIIKYDSSPQSGAIPLEEGEMKDTIASLATANLQNNLWATTVEEWQNAANIDKHTYIAEATTQS